jgi:hypothetical protein
MLAPQLARSLVLKLTALRRDLDEYLAPYNSDRATSTGAHTGRHTQGRVPAEFVYDGPQDASGAMNCRAYYGLAQPRLVKV